MRALTLWQPWASLVAVGAKQLETRSWAPPPDIRDGAMRRDAPLLAIHAAKALPPAKQLYEEPFCSAWLSALRENRAGQFYAEEVLEELPRGAVLCVVRVTGVFQVAETVRWWGGKTRIPPEPPELHFGHYAPLRYAWRLELVHRLDEPIAARGGQRIWNWTAPAELQAQLGVVK